MPALAKCAAMRDPMVPAPSTATRRMVRMACQRQSNAASMRTSKSSTSLSASNWMSSSRAFVIPDAVSRMQVELIKPGAGYAEAAVHHLDPRAPTGFKRMPHGSPGLKKPGVNPRVRIDGHAAVFAIARNVESKTALALFRREFELMIRGRRSRPVRDQPHLVIVLDHVVHIFLRVNDAAASALMCCISPAVIAA